MPSVRFAHVSKSYGRGQQAVHDVSLEIDNGELLVLVGPSGCGKSTLLRMVAGLEEITQGEITIGERVVNEIAPRDRDVAMVFQNYALYPHMTVFDNMAFGLRRRHLEPPEIDRRVRAAAATLGLDGYLQRRPRELSGGERQRVALGRAMVRDPQVFLFDEPLSNLDAKLRVQMRAEIKRLHQRTGTTMIYVTHDQVEAMTLGDRIAVMRQGLLLQVADPFTLYNHPANPFVAGFIGSPPINFFTARVAAGGVLESGETRLALPASWTTTLASRVGQELTAGIRPEDLSLEPVEGGGRITARADVREPLGNEVLVHWESAVGPLISRIPGQHAPDAGENATLHFAWDRLHLFDPATDRALEPGR